MNRTRNRSSFNAISSSCSAFTERRENIARQLEEMCRERLCDWNGTRKENEGKFWVKSFWLRCLILYQCSTCCPFQQFFTKRSLTRPLAFGLMKPSSGSLDWAPLGCTGPLCCCISINCKLGPDEYTAILLLIRLLVSRETRSRDLNIKYSKCVLNTKASNSLKSSCPF